MEQLERLTARLDNIEAVQPMLHALRAISSSTRLLALNRLQHCAEYRDGLSQVVALIQPFADLHQGLPEVKPSRSRAELVLVVGSERGLCGAFNDTVVGLAERVLEARATAGVPVQLMTMGTRLRRVCERRGWKPVWSERLSATGLPSYALAERLSGDWLDRHREQDLGGVEVVYNAYQGLARYEPCTLRLLPAEIPQLEAANAVDAPWLETDPHALYARLIRLWLSARLYGVLVESAAAEHSARFRLLDGASQNAEHLIDELTLYLQTARQDGITTELQDLAAGAGLLGQPPA